MDQSTAINTALDNLSKINRVEIGTAPRTVVWEEGKVRLYHFKRDSPATAKTPVLIVYALVNRWEMMDLQPDRSFIRKLLSEGLDVYLIDWGYATRLDRYKSLSDYVLGDLDDCVEEVRQRSGVKQINLMGVCQGGAFSVMYAALRPQKIKNFINLITPVDFSTNEGFLFKWAKDLDVDALVDHFGGLVPGQFLNMGFDLLRPLNKTRKYFHLPKVLQDEGKLLNFFRMERWVSDSPDQAGETFRQFVKDCYQQNKLIRNEMVLDGEKVHLKQIKMPTLTIFARDDHIVPPETTKPLHEHIGAKDKKLMEFPGGHIGVFVGSRSQQLLTPAVAEWLKERD